jgi:hypothetical protein
MLLAIIADHLVKVAVNARRQRFYLNGISRIRDG